MLGSKIDIDDKMICSLAFIFIGFKFFFMADAPDFLLLYFLRILF